MTYSDVIMGALTVLQNEVCEINMKAKKIIDDGGSPHAADLLLMKSSGILYACGVVLEAVKPLETAQTITNVVTISEGTASA